MNKTTKLLVFFILLYPVTNFAMDSEGDDDNKMQTPVYGSQLMTPEEQVEHRERMRNAKTIEEREKIRREHHEKMKQRAKELGIELPDEPPSRKHMIKPGAGMGSGMGRGNGRADR